MSRSGSRRPARSRPVIALLLLASLLAVAGCRREERLLDPRAAALARLELVRPPRNRDLEPFFLDRFEVTRGLFGAWRGVSVPARQAALPLVGVTPAGAQEFARWRGMRLPLVAEWETALGIGPDGEDSFPWGRSFDLISWDELKCNTAELGLGHLAPVGVFELGATEPGGIYDLVGNAAEWVVHPPRPGGTVLPARIRLFFLRRFAGRLLRGELAERVDRLLDMALFHLHVAPRLLEQKEWLAGARPLFRVLHRLGGPFRLPGLGEIRASLREEDPVLAALLAGPLSPLRPALELRELPHRLARGLGMVLAVVELERFLPSPFRGAGRIELEKLSRLSLAEWEAVERPYAAAGWDYQSYLEQVGGGGIGGRLSARMGREAMSSTIGFRCAASPGEILEWLAGPGGPPLEGPSGRRVGRFLREHRELFAPLAAGMGKGARPARLRELVTRP